jgi:hypothetical protein
MRQVVSICNLFCIYSLTRIPSYLFSFKPKIMRFKDFFLCSWYSSISLFISSLMCLISNLPSKLFRALLFIFSSNYLILFLKLKFYRLLTYPSWVDCFFYWLCFFISCSLISIFCNLASNPKILLSIYFLILSLKDLNLLSSITSNSI